MKLKETNKQIRYTFDQNQVLCRHFSYSTSRRRTRSTKTTNASLTQTPQNPSHHPAWSNRHLLQQPHKEPTPQPRSYWSTRHSTHANTKPTCTVNWSATKSHRWNATLNATLKHIWEILLVCVQVSASWHLIPTEKPFIFYYFDGMLCGSASIGWCRTQNNIRNSQSMLLVFALLSAFLFF